MRRLVVAAACAAAAACRLQHVPPGPPEDVIARGPFAGMLVVRLRNGANDVDLDGDGGLDLVFSAWRQNQSAQGYTTTTFYWQKRDSLPGPRWQLVPFFDANDAPPVDALVASGGAHCLLTDQRLLRPGATGERKTIVVAASRDHGPSLADSAGVTFTVYALERGTAGRAGEPPRRFRVARTFRAAGRYCDVGDAFARELYVLPDTTSDQ